MSVQEYTAATVKPETPDQQAASACCGDDPQASCCGTIAATCCTSSDTQPVDTACCERAAAATAPAPPLTARTMADTDISDPAALPVAVIGAGPVGLAAAAHLLQRGERPIVFESGATVGASMLEWGHVRLFSPWQYTVDVAAGSMLQAHGWHSPDPDTYPTGRAIVEQYLAPLAALPEMRLHLRLKTRVVSISRKGFDKMKTVGREQAPFLVTVRDTDGHEAQVEAKAVIDASGTYRTPNPLGASGVPAVGERALADRIYYGIPDVLGSQRARYAGRRVLVIGSGHSAFNAILDLVTLAHADPTTQIVWAVRRKTVGHLFGGGENDVLPARGELGVRVRRLVETGQLRLVTGFSTTELRASGDGIVVSSVDQVLPVVDEIVATTGFRPDLSMLSEVRLGLDPGVEAPVALAPLIDPNFHSCGTVRPHGVVELSHPEPGFYVVGMKSYGRAPTFLMLTGYEQVRSIAAAISGDWEAARAVELVLPETGVCSVSGSTGGDLGCCGASAEVGAACGTSESACSTAPATTFTIAGKELISLSSVGESSSAGCCG